METTHVKNIEYLYLGEKSNFFSDSSCGAQPKKSGLRPNHLGNVHLVLSDRKQTSTYENTLAAYEYYPFGMAMQTYETDAYRYGFNGMEKDDEWNGSGNSYDFGARIYDSRLGRWYSGDKFFALYAPNSSYSFSLNQPLFFVDKTGEKVTDSDGNVVTVTPVKGPDGNWKITYQFDPNTSEKAKKKFNKAFAKKWEKPLLALAQTKSGRRNIQEMNDMPTEIGYKVQWKMVKKISGSGRKNNPRARTTYAANIPDGETSSKPDVIKEGDKTYWRYITKVLMSQTHMEENVSTFRFSTEEEWIGAIMTVEIGHLMQVDLDASENNSITKKQYSPLLNRIITYSVEYRLAKKTNEKVDLKLFEIKWGNEGAVELNEENKALLEKVKEHNSQIDKNENSGVKNKGQENINKDK